MPTRREKSHLEEPEAILEWWGWPDPPNILGAAILSGDRRSICMKEERAALRDADDPAINHRKSWFLYFVGISFYKGVCRNLPPRTEGCPKFSGGSGISFPARLCA